METGFPALFTACLFLIGAVRRKSTLVRLPGAPRCLCLGCWVMVGLLLGRQKPGLATDRGQLVPRIFTVSKTLEPSCHLKKQPASSCCGFLSRSVPGSVLSVFLTVFQEQIQISVIKVLFSYSVLCSGLSEPGELLFPSVSLAVQQTAH